jgi:1-deoxy-D-xylulose-5-phosphate synthase
VIAVIGDGAMSAGMAYEAMNNAGALRSRLIVILNDNDMSIAPPVGAMSAYLARLLSGRPYLPCAISAGPSRKTCPSRWNSRPSVRRSSPAASSTGGTLFEELGFYYVGPIDGHNLDHLLPVLKNARDSDLDGRSWSMSSPRRARAMPRPRPRADKYHGVNKFDVITGEAVEAGRQRAASYTSVFGKALIAEAEADKKIVAITAAMPSGTGLDKFAERFPERTFDVGIAEQHGVTFAAGLATEASSRSPRSTRPSCSAPTTRWCTTSRIQKLPVRFAIDRAGLVGADGADPCRFLRRRLSRQPAGLRGDGRGGRTRTDAHGRHGGADRRPALGLPLSARRGGRHRIAG